MISYLHLTPAHGKVVMIGKTISHYKIVAKLGEGGMGVVYQADDTKLRRSVALKFLSASLMGSGDEKQRFLQEAQAAAALNHTNIAIVYEIDEAELGEGGKRHFMAMEHISGQSLHELVDKPLPLAEAIEYAIH